MSMADIAAARQLLAEERFGVPIRTMQRRELEEIEATKDTLRWQQQQLLNDGAD